MFIIAAVYSGMGPDFRIITKKAQKKANTYYATYGVYFSGFEIDTNSQTLVQKVKSLNADAIVKITDSNGTVKTNKSLATGDKISITSAGEEKSYTIVIYGDTSGNGKIDPLDLLRVQKAILGTAHISQQ